MAAKYVLVLCATACFAKTISAQCMGTMNSMAGSALGAEELALSGSYPANRALGAYGPGPLGYPAGYGAASGYGFNTAPSSGGGFPVTSTSPISPTGITVVSDNAIEGPLSITGQLPFLGTIALEGALPTAGAGAINYGCGNGAVGIVSEGVAPAMAPGAYPAGFGYGAAGMAGGLGYPGLAGSRPLGLGHGAGLNAGMGAGFGHGPVY